MPVREFLRRLSSAGRSRASSSSSSTKAPENLPSFTSEPSSVSDTHQRALSTEDDQYPQISPRKFEQRYRTRWPSCVASDNVFGPGGPTAFWEALDMDIYDDADGREAEEFNSTNFAAESVGREGVNHQASIGENNGLGSGKERSSGLSEGGNHNQETNNGLDGKSELLAKTNDRELPNDMGRIGEKKTNEDSKNRNTDLDGIEEISALYDQIAKLQGMGIGQEEIQCDEIDPVAGKIALENERPDTQESREWKHHCILDGHLFMKKIHQKIKGKTMNMVGDKGVRCQICCQSMKNVDFFICDIRACGITSCFGCAQRLDNERRGKALESWRLS